ncbi:hypothetical protein PVL30_002878 [Lodderomyces elongisporus]|uniref:DUF202 domain-containing protein n=1 Tax=Lodderomyces elongisporus (strain ATCC 11503 / CBS 2605 / JCM 1781 / NBRC 1676 / NRRL YB-4239) TaxID=379508 RepID=A5E194_LODEL|nr:uncharacterized protein PVL30_002878 [Lodderomyces elongisporus]EDK45202.1 conserved hypothetical protein [Lodderomyces elongisporus NRRL YB-4239]WLF79127.1 hypothetical protein PVL30_002878 [Lodderomyces elongisporus]
MSGNQQDYVTRNPSALRNEQQQQQQQRTPSPLSLPTSPNSLTASQRLPPINENLRDRNNSKSKSNVTAPTSPNANDLSSNSNSNSNSSGGGSKSNSTPEPIQVNLLNYKSITLENKGSVARDHMANERTFLAWLRTSLGFITLGIGVTQLFRLDKNDTTVRTTNNIIMLMNSKDGDELVRYGKPLGAIFIVLGILTLLLGFYRFFLVQKFLTINYYPAARVGIAILLFLVLAVVLVTFGMVVKTSLV